MTARRFAELANPIVKLAAFILLLIGMLLATPMKAQNSHPADQLYIPVVYHVARSTDLTFTNFTTDRVSVALTFIPVNTKLTDPEPLPIYRVRLAPGQSLTEEIGKYGISGQGMLILNVCKEFGACGYVRDPSRPNETRYLEQERDFREISVSARVYWTDSNGGTRGDSMTATSWRVEPGIDRTALSSISLVGIRSDARYKTRIGMVNGSQFSSSCMTVTLFDGNGVKRGERTECLGPLEGVERSAEEMFPDLVANRLNRRPLIVGPWVRITQGGIEPNGMAKSIVGCEDGCPRFDAYAAVSDSTSGDFWFERSTFEPIQGGVNGQAERSASVQGKEAQAGGGTLLQRAIHPLPNSRVQSLQVARAVEPRCSIVGPDRHDGSYLVSKPAPGQDGIPWYRKVMLPVMRVTASEVTVTRALCSGVLEGVQ